MKLFRIAALRFAIFAAAFLGLEACLPPLGGFETPAAAQTQPNFGQAVGPGTSGFLQNWAAQFYGYPLAVSNLTGCATGGSPSVTGSQASFRVVAGTTASTTCTITWPITRSQIPVCNITGETTALLTVTTNSTAALTWTFASTASTVWDVNCLGATP